MRRKAAARFGIKFDRSTHFHLPAEIVIRGDRHRLWLPDEHGIKIAFVELLLDDCYGCRRISKPVKTILDIGANVGLFGLMAREIFPDAVIHAYEPNPNLEPYLKHQAKIGSFECFMEAVGLDHGKVSLTFAADSVQTRSFNDQAGDIKQTAFREIIRRIGDSVDLVKMDCEGTEWPLFQDVESWSRVRHLSLEYHLWPGCSEKEALDKVRALGFYIRYHKPLDGFGLIWASRYGEAFRKKGESVAKS